MNAWVEREREREKVHTLFSSLSPVSLLLEFRLCVPACVCVDLRWSQITVTVVGILYFFSLMSNACSLSLSLSLCRYQVFRPSGVLHARRRLHWNFVWYFFFVLKYITHVKPIIIFCLNKFVSTEGFTFFPLLLLLLLPVPYGWGNVEIKIRWSTHIDEQSFDGTFP